MSFFNQYPYLNLNDLNLDFILNAIKEMRNEVTNFVSINAIKYADPIQWNITRQYEKNTIVIDPVTGTAYISVAPVPSGVALTRPEYWTVVFDLGSFVTRAAQNFTRNWESETTTTATFSTPAGGWLVWGDVLYSALVNITAGDAYVVGSNIEHFTIEDLYNAYLNTVASILAKIGDLTDLDTADKTDIVSAINENVANIGDLSTLTTTDKNSIVNAINGVNAGLAQEVINRGNADNVITTRLNKANVINVLNHGAVGDGVTNDTLAIQNAITDAINNNKVLYIPTGNYIVDGITISNYIDVLCEGVLVASNACTSVVTINVPYFGNDMTIWHEKCTMRFNIDGNGTASNGIDALQANHIILENTMITNVVDYGIKMSAFNPEFIINNCFIEGSGGSCTGIKLGDDSEIDGLIIKSCAIAIDAAGSCFMKNIHAWTTSFAGSICVMLRQNVFINIQNLYSDTYQYVFKRETGGKITCLGVHSYINPNFGTPSNAYVFGATNKDDYRYDSFSMVYFSEQNFSNLSDLDVGIDNFTFYNPIMPTHLNRFVDINFAGASDNKSYLEYNFLTHKYHLHLQASGTIAHGTTVYQASTGIKNASEKMFYIGCRTDVADQYQFAEMMQVYIAANGDIVLKTESGSDILSMFGDIYFNEIDGIL